ncbi:MAG: tRNA pseudouridine(38-40) synthase TruA [Lachnospiraceae bacterium]|nr:tRNA pseudouridine(38-40) synthase TruA [Lachnospiraceae bacterium]
MSSKNLCITLQYDGSRYDGWQRQGNTDNTIQGRLETMLSKLFEQEIEVNGSGRTDAGVHAVGQVANFHVNTPYGPGKILELMNRYLPKDIAVTDVRIADARFHARLNAKSKTYRYRISTGYVRPVFERQQILWCPEDLDIERMREAAALLVGEHDYTSFCGNKHMKKSCVRTVTSIEIEEVKTVCGETEYDEVRLTFSGNGFLQNMVRIMVGTLLEVGRGERGPAEMTAILAAKDRERAGAMAPAHGLTLWKVEY